MFYPEFLLNPCSSYIREFEKKSLALLQPYPHRTTISSTVEYFLVFYDGSTVMILKPSPQTHTLALRLTSLDAGIYGLSNCGSRPSKLSLWLITLKLWALLRLSSRTSVRAVFGCSHPTHLMDHSEAYSGLHFCINPHSSLYHHGLQVPTERNPGSPRHTKQTPIASMALHLSRSWQPVRSSPSILNGASLADPFIDQSLGHLGSSSPSCCWNKMLRRSGLFPARYEILGSLVATAEGKNPSPLITQCIL